MRGPEPGDDPVRAFDHRSSGEDGGDTRSVRCTIVRVRSGHSPSLEVPVRAFGVSLPRRVVVALRAAARGVHARRRRVRRRDRPPTISATRSCSREAPRRIVSLNPTTTELLFAIGAGGRLVGRTHVRSLARRRRSRFRISAPGCARTSRASSRARPDLVLLYASDDNRDAARRLRGAGVATARVPRRPHRRFPRESRARAGRAHRRLAPPRAPPWTPCGATLERVRAATAARPRPTVFWPLWDSAAASRSAAAAS